MYDLTKIMVRLFQSRSKYLTISVPNEELSFSYIIRYSGQAEHLDRLPMLIALHGDGGTVDDFYETALDKFKVPARIILIKAPIAHECGNVWPYSADQFIDYGKAFSDVVELLTIKYPTVNKPVLLGFSGGGTMAYYQAVKHGNSYSYIFPVSGLLFNEQLDGSGLSTPGTKVYAYHGKTDEVVPFTAGKKAIKLLKKQGVRVSFTQFDYGHHGIFSDMKSQITQAVEEKLDGLTI